jgi:ssDNA-binding Zn-finger/Zn-ribbon topoisomerase 1
MKFGIRTPSLKRRIAARTSVKRYVRHNLGLKAPRGMGWITNPKKAAYNRVYNRTSVSVDKLFSSGSRRSRSSGGDAILVFAVFGLLIVVIKILFAVIAAIFKMISGHRKSEQSIQKVPQGQLDRAPMQSAENLSSDSVPKNNPTPEASPSCPICSQSMIRRTARRGRNAGSDFWGCAKFPRCRGTRSIDNIMSVKAS